MATQRTTGAALIMVDYNAKVDASGMELWLRHTQVVLHHAHLCRHENSAAAPDPCKHRRSDVRICRKFHRCQRIAALINNDMPTSGTTLPDTCLAHGWVDAGWQSSCRLYMRIFDRVWTSKNNTEATGLYAHFLPMHLPLLETTHRCQHKNHCISLYICQACAQYRPIEISDHADGSSRSDDSLAKSTSYYMQ